MSKELVISTTRHETKVAILEDDQLVEVYFQRANEYSLAGSIHKGRVTRVLPGMQSAFVDLGLERDTFLYVSDFFEENPDEYDTAPPAEGRGRRGERERERRAEPQHTPRATAIEPPPSAVEEPKVEAAEVPVVAVAEAAVPPAAKPEEQGGADFHERRGRRSRRRRGRGRGFPESKYASDVAAPSQAEPAPAEEVEVEVEETVVEEVILLPGESLAKYRNAQPAAAAHHEPTPLETSEPLALGEQLAEAQQHGEIPADEAAEETEAVAAEAVAAAVEPGEPANPNEEAAEEFAEEVDEPRAELEAPEFALEPALEEEIVAEEDEAAEEDAADESAEAAEEGESEEPVSPADAAHEAAMRAEAGEEPLTATVRDSSSRYTQQHRVNRRMRRRGVRGGQQSDRSPERTDRVDGLSVEELRAQKAESRDSKGQPLISDLLREGQEIIVQIAKEPLGQKGARITSHIALPGRYVVYMPTLEHLGVSRKISSDEERLRLKRILQQHRTGITGGFIVRTAGEGRSEGEIAGDMAFLYNLWLDMRQKAEKRPAPVLLHHDLDIVERLLRDQLNDEFKAIWCDDEDAYESIVRFMQRFQPTLVGKVKLYTRTAPIFDAFNISSELEKALRPKVWLKSGGYIVINQTEALVAIDVNTGKYVGKSNRLEDTIVKTNVEAVREIVRQIRLRDLGGIIVVDFIDMDERKNRQKVIQALEETMRVDRAPYKVLPFNDFGLVAITRKRVKQSLERTLCSLCPTCEGSGYVKSVPTVIGEILQEAHKLRGVIEDKNAVLRCHPDVAKVLKSHENKYLEEIEEILGRPVMVTSDVTIHPENYDLA
jgi:ribonuclease G